MLILGIESSCDESAVALVRNGKEVVASLVASQIELHAPYGGVVPEVACRAHMEWLLPLLTELLAQHALKLQDIDVIATTARPGLMSSLLVGLSTGKALAWALQKPFIGVDHIQGHLYAPVMAHPKLPFPHIALVVSGGHSELCLCTSPIEQERIVATLDDAAGECFDKVSALLGLGYPGGPAIEKAALKGDPKAIHFPRSRNRHGALQMSFSGLKTAVLYYLQRSGYAIQAGRPRLAQKKSGHNTQATRELSEQARADIAASFQEAALDILVRAALQACVEKNIADLSLTGGVACNSRLRQKLEEEASKKGISLYPAPRELCTDNAAFIAGLAYEYARLKRYDTLELTAQPRR